MLIIQSPMKTETTRHVCGYHKRNPGDRNYAGCTCGGSYSAVVKPRSEWTDAEKRAYFRGLCLIN